MLTANKEIITQYLLGALPEAETERFDELSIADDEFVELLKTTEKDVIDAYVTGELTGANLAHFESYYLDSPLRREKVRLARALQDWNEQKAIPLRTQAGSENRKAKIGRTNRFSRLDFLSYPRLSWGMALAGLVLFVALGWLIVQDLSLRQQVIQTQTKRDELLRREQELQKSISEQRSAASAAEQQLAQLRAERERLEQELKSAGHQAPNEGKVVAMTLLPPMRGGGQIHSLAIRPGDSVVSARLQLEAADYPFYEITLTDPSNNKILWRSGKLKAKINGDSKAVSVSFPAGLLKPQTYALRVSGVSPKGALEVMSDYPFRVVK